MQFSSFRYFNRVLRKTIPAIIFLFVYTTVNGQKEANNWYFGYGAGLNFNSGEPVFQKGSIRQWEGCASISDKNGNLLFYTNGNAVWNKDHQVMPNGKGLKGHNSSTQSSIIVPQPGNSRQYYLFTIASGAAADGLQYSILDMQAQNGLGDIVQKNIPVLSPVCEKITAVRHTNNRDIWVITHKYNTDEYYAYLVTADGVSNQPVISRTGNIISGGLNTIGYLKASANGAKLAAAHMTSFTEVMDFNTATGGISNPIKLMHDQRAYAYGVEFSKDAGLLYTTEMNHTNGSGSYAVFQYQVSSNADSMNTSKQPVATGDVGGAAGALQLGPDNKLYIAFNQKQYLGCVQHPERRGEACAFKLEYVSLSNAKSGLGLPSFIQSYLLHAGATSGYLMYIEGLAFLVLLLVLFLLYRKRKNKKTDEGVTENNT